MVRALQEPAVSGYEPSSCETFAEAMKLFILNPDLLRTGRPQRWELITGLGLDPIVDDDWRTILQFAHPRIIDAAENWLC